MKTVFISLAVYCLATGLVLTGKKLYLLFDFDKFDFTIVEYLLFSKKIVPLSHSFIAPSPDHHHHKSDGHNHTADTHVHTGHHHGDGHSHEHHTPSDGHKHAAGTHVHSDETHTKCHSPMSPTVACNKTEFFFDQASDSCKQRPANQCGSATSMNKFDSLATCMSLCKEKIMDAPAASGKNVIQARTNISPMSN